MARPKGSFGTPSYRLHKATGQAVVTLAGKDHYLGVHGTDESREKYRRMLAEYRDRGGVSPASTPASVSVMELAAGFWTWAQKRFEKEQSRKGYLGPLRVLCEQYGATPATAFTPMKLKALRLALARQKIRRGKRKGEAWSRQGINLIAKRIKRVFRWGADTGIIPPSTYHALLSVVKPLKRGEVAGIREMPKVQSVTKDAVDATLPFLNPMVRAMVELQLLTGMRCGEVFVMRGVDLDLSDPACWIYRPSQHKTHHLGTVRTVPIERAAQDVLRPWLKRDLHAFVFTPRESNALHFEARLAAAKHKGKKLAYRTAWKRRRARAMGVRPLRFRPTFTATTYDACIRVACQRADAAAHEKRPDVPADERIVPHWHSHQLRHAFITQAAKTLGLKGARLLAGHEREGTTRGYVDDAPAEYASELKRYASKIG